MRWARLVGTLAVLVAVLATALPCPADGTSPALPERGRNQGTGQSVTPITPPPPPPAQATQVPTVEPTPSLGPLTGVQILDVTVVLEGNIWSDVQPPAPPRIAPGETLSAAVARRALQEVLATGRFARGRVSAQPEAGGAVLVIRVVPRKLVGRLQIDLHGASIDTEEVLRAADLSEGGEIVAADVEQITARVARVFAAHGYPSAIVDVQTRETDDPARALVVLDVKPGAPRRVQDRYFYVFGTSPEAGDVTPLEGAYGVRVGDRADESNVDTADVALEGALRTHGWYRAHVTHDLVLHGEPPRDPRVALRVRIDAGPRQVHRFEGNEHFDGRALHGALELDTDSDRSPGHLAEKLRTFYQKRGFLDVEVRPEVRSSENGTIELILFHIRENARAVVVSRRYPCLKLDVVRRLENGGPRSSAEIGTEIDSFLEEELPGADLLVDPDPRGLSATIGAGAGPMAIGARPEPIDLHPNATYVTDTYERATAHVQELYRNEGFLHAQVGPVQVVRATCDPRSPPNRCVPRPLPEMPTQLCTYDATGLPLPVAPLPAEFTCRPDPDHGVECDRALQLIIPVKLGPRTTLWDVAFKGVKSVSEEDLADAAALPLGDPVSTSVLDDARRRIVDWYKENGYAYVDVKYALEPSLDNTRARVRFDVTEGDQVIVRSVVIRGLDATRESVVRRRLAIEVGQPFRTSSVRKTQERVATLGVFSSISVTLSDPYVPAPSKTVIVEVVERLPEYIELRPGFSTGEGVRGSIEFGHINLLGYAWGLTIHGQASYLPDLLILDPQVLANYSKLQLKDRIATRDTVTLSFPEMGLGPTIRAQLDGIFVRDLERDFTLQKGAGIGTLIWRPEREIQLTGGASFEQNAVTLFDYGSIESLLAQPQYANNADLARLLRVPNGESQVLSQRAVVTWDRRDSAFNAHKGTYVAASLEHVDSFPVRSQTSPDLQFESHFLRLTQTLGWYLPFGRGFSLASELRLGEIVNVSPCSTPFVNPGILAPKGGVKYCTYPDRLFFMGGFDSMRGWLQDSFMPQEYANLIKAGTLKCVSTSNCTGVPLRGGNLMLNPRVELRFPVKAPIDGALFADFGNVWNDPATILQQGLALRTDVGAGLRVQTPVGPLVFDYGINVTRRSYEDFGAFHFAIGLF